MNVNARVFAPAGHALHESDCEREARERDREREIEALGVELESGIITQYEHDISIVTLQITMALEAIKNSNIGFREPDRKFGESVLAYGQSGKRLSEKQILAVTPMLGRYALVLNKLGIDLSIKNTNLWAMAYFKASFSPELVYSLNHASTTYK